MANKDIGFTFGEKRYHVGIEAYDRLLPIVLPDNTVLDVMGWNESNPPVPAGLRKREQDQLGFDAEETARLVDGALAREA